MMSQQQNDLITRIGPRTPPGNSCGCTGSPQRWSTNWKASGRSRRSSCSARILFCSAMKSGRYGLIDRDCPHRGADLAFGRLENGGLRCAFHGWLFDVDGQCLETPAEPGSSAVQRISSSAPIP